MQSTRHVVHFKNGQNPSELPDRSVDLVVTSPPYPMIEMWDASFSALNPSIGEALERGDGRTAHRLMHEELARIWSSLPRLLNPGSWVCINIGDATRTIGDRFQLFPNHSRIVETFYASGFDCLPPVLWRKQTNAPNKFLGSGVLPAGAYVTLEHEYILLFRFGGKRAFTSKTDAENRRESALFWEERNVWFSDLWDFKGTNQRLDGAAGRSRSGAFPFELAYRLINMYSVIGDTVLDPFMGTGTTAVAAAASNRQSVGFEIDPSLATVIDERMRSVVESAKGVADERLRRHKAFVGDYEQRAARPRHTSSVYGFPVISRQEVALRLPRVESVRVVQPGSYEVTYVDAGPSLVPELPASLGDGPL